MTHWFSRPRGPLVNLARDPVGVVSPLGLVTIVVKERHCTIRVRSTWIRGRPVEIVGLTHDRDTGAKGRRREVGR